uniref:Uncharacterized protein n=1 Tax=Candidatus Nitrotoga fabula TaxID=2182327 RepID=A0A2X0R7I3_9PROT|nr:protein of unknown function [Candidatus Nitrotoga fabula]
MILCRVLRIGWDIEPLLPASVHFNDDEIQAFVQVWTELIARITGDTHGN